MLFTGTSEHTLDAKLRLAIPAKYRNQWNPERDGGDDGVRWLRENEAAYSVVGRESLS